MSPTQVFCPSCGTQQPISEKCVNCGYAFPPPRVIAPSEVEPTRPIASAPPSPSAAPAEAAAETAAAASAPEAPAADAAPSTPGDHPPGRRPHPHAHRPAPAKPAPRGNSTLLVVAAVAVAGGIALVFFLRGRSEEVVTPAGVEAPAPDAAQARIEQLRTERDRNAARSGTWSGSGAGKGRTAEATVTADEEGKIREATVVVREGTDGILAGFQVDPKAGELLREILAGYDPTKKTVEANLPFLRFDAWATPGPRVWKAIEGVERIPRKRTEETTDLSMFVDYLVLESAEPDVLIQAGISRKGIVMFLNGSRKFSEELSRGSDLVSKMVHPGQNQEIERFDDLIFNFGGGLSFVSGRVDGAVASPLAPAEGIAVSLQRQP